MVAPKNATLPHWALPMPRPCAACHITVSLSPHIGPAENEGTPTSHISQISSWRVTQRGRGSSPRLTAHAYKSWS